ncbi:unnamed protein product [Tilletia laevis]|uniref:Uncharacterized protein n=1 Tax=Tilletia caries TaxID=13290 RepID=A0ABN7JDP8_9BASI|nr:unnamed protein product [Tilletia laevis]CAD6957188.1 unnamed protein product [Tilletia caries]
MTLRTKPRNVKREHKTVALGLSQRSLAPPITQQFVHQDVDDRTISAISALQALRQQDTSSSLVPPTTTAIREALRSRYASLDRWKIDSIEDALEILDEAVYNGLEGTEEADQQFSR